MKTSAAPKVLPLTSLRFSQHSWSSSNTQSTSRRIPTTFIGGANFSTWLVVLGEASYGLYLLHIPLWHIFGLNYLTASPIAYMLYIATALAISVLSFYFFETPVRRRILQYFTTPSRESVVTSSMAQ